MEDLKKFIVDAVCEGVVKAHIALHGKVCPAAAEAPKAEEPKAEEPKKRKRRTKAEMEAAKAQPEPESDEDLGADLEGEGEFDDEDDEPIDTTPLSYEAMMDEVRALINNARIGSAAAKEKAKKFAFDSYGVEKYSEVPEGKRVEAVAKLRLVILG